MPPKKQPSSSALTADKQTLKKQTSSSNANKNAHDADDADSDHQAMAPPSKSLKKQTSKILDQQTPAATAAPAKISPPVKQASLKKTYFEMIVEAIKDLNKGKSGSSKQAIEKWVRENYALEESACNKGVKNALNANVENKNLWQVTGKGASGSFALMSDRPKKAAAAAAAATAAAAAAKDKKAPSKSATASKKKATVQVEKENESDEEEEEEPVVAKKTGKAAAASKSVPKVASKTKATLPKKTVAKKAVEKVASKSQGSAAAKANSKKEAKNEILSEPEDEEDEEDEEEEAEEEETHQATVI